MLSLCMYKHVNKNKNTAFQGTPNQMAYPLPRGVLSMKMLSRQLKKGDPGNGRSRNKETRLWPHN